eukprot:scaffold140586_cov386-Phaeocystis_antarctica.AAC.1
MATLADTGTTTCPAVTLATPRSRKCAWPNATQTRDASTCPWKERRLAAGTAQRQAPVQIASLLHAIT